MTASFSAESTRRLVRESANPTVGWSPNKENSIYLSYSPNGHAQEDEILAARRGRTHKDVDSHSGASGGATCGRRRRHCHRLTQLLLQPLLEATRKEAKIDTGPALSFLISPTLLRTLSHSFTESNRHSFKR